MVAITLFSQFPFFPEKVHSQPILFSCLLRRSVWSNTFCTWIFPTFTAQERSQNLLQLWSSLIFTTARLGTFPLALWKPGVDTSNPAESGGEKTRCCARRGSGNVPDTRNNPLPAESRALLMGQQRTSQQMIPYCKTMERIRAQADLTGLVWLGQFRRRLPAVKTSCHQNTWPGQGPRRVQVPRAGR